jgi:hypothetical protein
VASLNTDALCQYCTEVELVYISAKFISLLSIFINSYIVIADQLVFGLSAFLSDGTVLIYSDTFGTLAQAS